MQLSWLLSFFDNSPSAGLLRSKHAPYIIDFLAGEFKGDGAVSRSQSELTESLRGYLERLRESDAELMTGTAEHYMADWCGSKKRFLRRFLDADHAEPMYELTAATEDTLTFVGQLSRRDRRFVGTESRLKRIIETLNDLALGASDDAELRLEHLRAERARIDQQIETIQSGGPVAIYSHTAVRERFGDAMTDLVQLQGDFRAVEESFKEITRDVQQRQLLSDDSRGQILGDALDAEEGLKGEDQGISFDEFARLILSPTKQEHVDSIIHQVTNISALSGDNESLQRIRDMVPSLTAEARKVLRTYQRLSTTLRRLLDQEVRSERQRLAQVLDEIRSMAVRMSDDNNREDAFTLEIDHALDLSLPSERRFWSPPKEFAEVQFATHETKDEDRIAAFTDLAMMKSLDWHGLRQRVSHAIDEEHEMTLANLVDVGEEYYDAVEVMGLIQIAHEDGHFIDLELTETILVRHADGTMAELEIPRVIFSQLEPKQSEPAQHSLAENNE